MSREGAECAWLADTYPAPHPGTCALLDPEVWRVIPGAQKQGAGVGLLCPGSLLESPDAQSLPCTSGRPQVLSAHPELSITELDAYPPGSGSPCVLSRRGALSIHAGWCSRGLHLPGSPLWQQGGGPAGGRESSLG